MRLSDVCFTRSVHQEFLLFRVCAVGMCGGVIVVTLITDFLGVCRHTKRLTYFSFLSVSFLQRPLLHCLSPDLSSTGTRWQQRRATQRRRKRFVQNEQNVCLEQKININFLYYGRVACRQTFSLSVFISQESLSNNSE